MNHFKGYLTDWLGFEQHQLFHAFHATVYTPYHVCERSLRDANCTNDLEYPDSQVHWNVLQLHEFDQEIALVMDATFLLLKLVLVIFLVKNRPKVTSRLA